MEIVITKFPRYTRSQGSLSILLLAFIAISGERLEDVSCTGYTYRELMTGLPENVYRGLYRHVAKEEGETRRIKIDGKVYTMTTRAVEPPIFEISNFLTPEECDALIELALQQGLTHSPLHGVSKWNILKGVYFGGDTRMYSRVSRQAWIMLYEDGGIRSRIRKRLKGLTKLPQRFFDDSEQMQVVKYSQGDHYHAHLDSSLAMNFMRFQNKTRNQFRKTPCCHQKICLNAKAGCCILCRYATVMFYLNDVEEGGETAFLRARRNTTERKSYNTGFNLSFYCDRANFRFKPKKGTALLWYNNFIDRKTGWLGDADVTSYHGGCDVIKGEKWIATNWIAVPTYNNRDFETIYTRRSHAEPLWSNKLQRYIGPIQEITDVIYNKIKHDFWNTFFKAKSPVT